jgi:polysaccharide export outer membrane protein
MQRTVLVPLLAVVACAVLAGSGAAAPAPAPSRVERPYLVGPPDDLLITIRPEPAIVRQVVVQPDGKISVDMVGEVQAGGRTMTEIANEIARRISPYIRAPQVTVSLVASKSIAITILGYVQRPATFPLQRDMRVSEALGLVAGPTEHGAASRIRVVRQTGAKPQVLKVNLDAIRNGDLSTNVLLEAGDIIYVPPTASASIGFALRGFFFPLQQIFGLGAQGARIAVTGGF